MAGVGDGIFLGYGDELRDLIGVNGGIDPTTSEYTTGYVAGFTTTNVVVIRGVTSGFRGKDSFRIINQNRYFRIGYNRHGGRSTFRVGGDLVEKITGRRHFDLGDGGPL